MPCERKHIEAIADAVDELWCIDTAQNYDLCGAAISAALAAIDESPWRSMESAPKPETRVLVMCEDGVVAAVVPGKTYGWYCYDNGCGCCSSSITPTHWMPLPAAPATDNAASDGGEGEKA